MSELNSAAVDAFKEAVQNGAEEAASSFERAFGVAVKIQSADGGAVQIETLNQKVAGQGLAMVLFFGGQGIVFLIPSLTGLVPDWCEHPDATQKSKLATLAQEWGMNLVPEDFFPEDFQAAFLHDVPQGLIRGQIALDAGYLELHLTKEGGVPLSVYAVWAFDEPAAVLKEPEPVRESIAPPPTFGGEPDLHGFGTAGLDPFANHDFNALAPKHRTLEDMPGYGRSALKVQVPVAAVLVKARKPIKMILELGVGSVIQFDKNCDELLEVEVGQTVTVATAEAVKVGDKFGFRINSILLPEERFRKVEVRREGEYRADGDLPQIIGKAPIRHFPQH
ncbi:MAG: FliM/FliN family flagellar motor C-terminal domain-containing protein [Planctomycetaceae bacterium]|jgi:flagellar motor switch protein FliN/FliY|nr:FliM/FliN family flagellar motor C-terminal domain-containing protein [Planctomycetaceae bacterium]